MVAMVGAPALAQDQPGAFGPRQGDYELTISGGGNNDRNFDAGQFNTNFELGHYLTSDLSVAVRQDVSWINGADTPDSWNAATRAVAQYHFDMGQFRPFIGANVGFKYGEDIRDTGTAGPEAGVKWYVKDETFIYGRVGFDIEFRNFREIDEDRRRSGTWVYAVGVGFNF
ncbi:MAG: OmpA family protein [Phycisphaeraceae bacterium]